MNSTKKSTRNIFSIAITVALMCLMTAVLIPGVMGVAADVNLLSAGDFVILANSGISSTGTTAITGDVGISPNFAASITGFSLVLPAGGASSSSNIVTGDVYAPDYAVPTPAKMTTAQNDMVLAYNAAKLQVDAPISLDANIGGQTLYPGLYTTATGVTIPTSVTLDARGDKDAVWVFQIAQTLTTSAGTRIILANGAQPKNIFWAVSGATQLGSSSVFNGNILDATGITLITGAKLNGRALAQTAVILDSNVVTLPTDPSVHGGPLVTSVSPSVGPLAGGNTVTILGSGFTSASTVTFDGTIPLYRVDSDTQITVTVPGPNAGAVAVVVTTPVGTGTKTDAYTYVDPPEFVSATTNTAGTVITITFDKEMASPVGKHGQFTYMIDGVGGKLFDNAAFNVDPAHTKIDLRVSGTPIAFGDSLKVSYTKPVAGYVTADDTSILATFIDNSVVNTMPAPPAVPPVFVSAATNVAGTVITITFDKEMASPVGKQTQFTYMLNGVGGKFFDNAVFNADPAHTKIDLRVSGTVIASGDTVKVSYTKPAVGYVTADDTGILATFTDNAVVNNMPAPPAVPPVFVSAATNTAGTVITITFDKEMASPVGKHGQFTYKIGAVGGELFDEAAFNADHTKIDLSVSGMPIEFGDTVKVSYTKPVAGYVTSVDTGILATFVDDAVVNNMPATVTAITNIAPATGRTSGGTSVIITGTDFTGVTGANGVRFGTKAAQSYLFNSDTQITAVSPSQAAGIVDIRVSTPTGGISAISLADKFTYVAPVPTITGIAPVSGTTAGGNSVVITGTGFTAATRVTFDGTVAVFTVDSDTKITATSPSHASEGTVDIAVTTAGGTATKSGAFTYVIMVVPVNLGSANNFVVLAKSGITNAGPTTSIVGDIGVSPIAATAITGFGLTADASNQYSTSSQVKGWVYAANYAPPTPAKMTAAISGMEAAYTEAMGRPLPDHTGLGDGNIGGLVLSPGLYKWTTGVTIPTDVTISGGQNDVWIFQIDQGLSINSDKKVILSGAAQAQNIYWVVAGQTTLGSGSVFNGVILDKTAIVMNSGATLNGRALAQTEVTLIGNTITATPLIPVASTVRSYNPPSGGSDSYPNAAPGIVSEVVSGGSDSSPVTIVDISQRAPVAVFGETPVNGIGLLTSNPLTADLIGMPGVAVSWQTQIADKPAANAKITTFISQKTDLTRMNAFITALHQSKLDLKSLAYVMITQKTGTTSTGPATVTMTASQDWVTSCGGIGAIRIVSIADDGTVTVLPTKFDRYDRDTGYLTFKAVSPHGLGTFGLVGVTSYTPSAGTATVQKAPAQMPVASTASTDSTSAPYLPVAGVVIVGALVVIGGAVLFARWK